MKAIHFIFKIMFLPVMVALGVIRLFAEFLAGISAVIFRVIAGIFLLTALLSYGLGLESSGECLKMVLAGFLFYLLPSTAEIVIAGNIFWKNGFALLHRKRAEREHTYEKRISGKLLRLE